MGIPDAAAQATDKGVTINMQNIQFAADSAELMPSETDKLDKIGKILTKYADRDIMVAGFTALAGTAETRKDLSERRARAVADYLIRNRVRKPEQVIIQGYGAEKPVADNSTEEGMRKNRRVEITILEN
jgi:outer membrane protein OmpA-like peptidoglycan-associated protein